MKITKKYLRTLINEVLSEQNKTTIDPNYFLQHEYIVTYQDSDIVFRKFKGTGIVTLQKGDKFKIVKLFNRQYIATIIDAKKANSGDLFIIPSFNFKTLSDRIKWSESI